MKLRIRSLETKETRRVEVPTPCTLSQLKDSIFLAFPSSASSSSYSLPSPDSIHLSLNRIDEIQSKWHDEDTLQSVGIASGDLVFFTLNPRGFSSQSLVANSQHREQPNRVMVRSVLIPVIPKEPCSNFSEKMDSFPESDVCLLSEGCDEPESSNLGAQNEELLVVDAADDEGFALEAFGSSFSAPGFLKKVFTAELRGGDDGGNHKLLLLAIHAVLLESGFVRFDVGSKSEVEWFLMEYWPKNMFLLSLFYTLPGIIGKVFPNSEYRNGVIVLKFQITGNVVNVYGSLCSGSIPTHSVCLNEDYLVPFLNVAWANCGLGEKIATKDGESFTSPGTEVFNFWKIVKDELALPLLIDLCDKAGLVLPPCFMRLPTELKLKILESLTGDDIAKVSCVCSELKYLASNDDLWKLKFVEKFGVVGDPGERGSWKEKFARSRRWQNRNKRMSSGFPYDRAQMSPVGSRRLPPIIGIVGGGYDLWPQNFYPLNEVGHLPSLIMLPTHIPPSNGNGHL